LNVAPLIILDNKTLSILLLFNQLPAARNNLLKCLTALKFLCTRKQWCIATGTVWYGVPVVKISAILGGTPVPVAEI